MSADLLQTVVAAARRSAGERERRRALIEPARPPDGERFRAALATPGIRIIAECKRRSPSRGVLRQAFDPAGIAREYADAGAAAISVLTEPTFFDGALEHLMAVRSVVDLPVLRKDFIVTPYQIAEARAWGADAVLLVAAALQSTELGSLVGYAEGQGLAALVEVHGRAELDRALEAGARLIGVNSRNLRTLEVDVSVFDDLAGRIPPAVVAVAESGLREAEDLRRLADLRYEGFLIGERFMTERHPGRALAGLLAAAGRGGRG